MDTSKLSPAAYALALVCFLLPFVELSCQGQRLASFTGVQVATGTSVKEPQMFGKPKERKIPPDLMVLGALGLSVLGLVLALKGGPSAAKPTGLVGIIATVLLLFFKSRTDNSVLSEGGGMIQVQYGLGFWGATALSAVAGVLGFASRPATAQPRPEPTASAPPAGPSGVS